MVLEPVGLEAMPDLPLVIGPAANRHAAELGRAARRRARSCKPMLAGATWVGGRRWDLRFQSGEMLALARRARPRREGAGPTSRGWTSTTQLLGRGFVRFDMRVPGKLHRPRLARTGQHRSRSSRRPTPGAGDVDDPATTI